MTQRVVILGMHRSGTSVVAHIVSRLGVPLADGCDLLAPQSDNPDGFGESRTLMEWDERILAAFGGSWSRPPDLAAWWETTPSALALGAPAREAFLKVHRPDSWACKDPRMCLTLPFWRGLLDPTVVVLVTRAPGSIAHSLWRRNHYRLRIGVALWEVYMRAALRACRGLAVVVVNYEQLTREPQASVAALLDGLRAAGVTPARDTAPAFQVVRAAGSRPLPEAPLTSAQRWLAGTLSNLEPEYASFPELELGPATPSLRWILRVPDALRYRDAGVDDVLARVGWR